VPLFLLIEFCSLGFLIFHRQRTKEGASYYFSWWQNGTGWPVEDDNIADNEELL